MFMRLSTAMPVKIFTDNLPAERLQPFRDDMKSHVTANNCLSHGTVINRLSRDTATNRLGQVTEGRVIDNKTGNVRIK
jgi:hypothetical protein